MMGWEDVHCQTSRFDIKKQSCPRALQPNVNTRSLDPPALGAAPNRLPPELAPLQESANIMAYLQIQDITLSVERINPPLGAPKRLPPPELAPAQNSDVVRTKHLRSRRWSSQPSWNSCANTVGLFYHRLRASAGERKVGKGYGKILVIWYGCL